MGDPVVTPIYEKRIPGIGYTMSFKIDLTETTFTLDAAAAIAVPIGGAKWIVYTDTANRGKIYWDDSAKRFKGQNFTNPCTLACQVKGEFAT